MKKCYLLIIGGLLCASSSSLFAIGISASATYTDSLVSPGVFQYDLTLNNTGTTTIGTFWFSWIPGAGFMSATPTTIVNPTGWTDIITNGGAAIQWKTLSSLLAPGGSLSGFQFDSTMSPTQMQMNFAGSGLGSGDPITTSFVYIAAPLADPGFEFVATPAATATPEPSTILSTVFGCGLIAFNLLRKSKRV